jgi:polyketide cyclase/dehydrase/lipid transport protein
MTGKRAAAQFARGGRGATVAGVADTVVKVDAGPRRVARQVLVRAPAAEVFALVANPHRHPELDGSGTVRPGPVTGPPVLSAGATFTVGMKQYGAPYKVTSTVTAFEDGQLVEWQHPMGHRWRWELAEVEPGVTRVTETFDYTTSRTPRLLEILGQPGKNAVGITKTLQGLQARFG